MATRPSPQPNVPGRGILAGYPPAFWLAVAVIGLAAGLAGAALLELLHGVERLAFGDHGGFLASVRASSDARVVLALFAAGVVAGAGGLVLRRLPSSGGSEVTEAIWMGDARLPLVPSALRAVVSVVTVGLGSSLGREAAPQLVGAAVATRAATRAALSDSERRLLVACGAGAGMAAVYDVPLGGALFALEVLLGTLTLPLVIPALATTSIATATAWIVVPTHPTYDIPSYPIDASVVVWAVLAGPLLGLLAVGWVRLVALANRRRPAGPRRAVVPVVVLTALGFAALLRPELLGNGSDTVELSMTGEVALGAAVVMLVLKPLASAACLGSGAPGGLFTPTLTVGALAAAVLGHLWLLIFGDTPLGGFVLVGGGAFLAAAMQGPLAAVALLVELTRQVDALMVPLLVATAEATWVARALKAPSIYSARL